MGWRKLLGLDYIDYTDQIFDSLIKTRYAKKQFSLILAMIITFFIRWNIKTFFSYMIQTHTIVDFFIQVLLSVLLVLKSGWIHNIVTRFQTEIYALSRYLINNYTPQNFRIWKRNVTLGICIYIIIQLLFIEVTSALLIEYVLEFLLSYFIVDGIEQGNFIKVYQWFKEKIYLYYRVTQRKSSVPYIIQDDYIDTTIPSFSSLEEEEIDVRKSWMGLDNVIVVEYSPSHSIVIFEDSSVSPSEMTSQIVS